VRQQSCLGNSKTTWAAAAWLVWQYALVQLMVLQPWRRSSQLGPPCWGKDFAWMRASSVAVIGLGLVVAGVVTAAAVAVADEVLVLALVYMLEQELAFVVDVVLGKRPL